MNLYREDYSAALGARWDELAVMTKSVIDMGGINLSISACTRLMSGYSNAIQNIQNGNQHWKLRETKISRVSCWGQQEKDWSTSFYSNLIQVSICRSRWALRSSRYGRKWKETLHLLCIRFQAGVRKRPKISNDGHNKVLMKAIIPATTIPLRGEES